jgi:Family of unknown function (DUF6444)
MRVARYWMRNLGRGAGPGIWPAQRVALITAGMPGLWWSVTARPLDAARDALSTLHGQPIALLAARVAELEAANAVLAEGMARLERAASRNSGNSSMPPSADDLPGRTPPPPRSRKAWRRPGKQPGAPGSHLAWSEHPDDTVPHFPQGPAGAGGTWPPRPIWGWSPRTRRSRSRWRRPG